MTEALTKKQQKALAFKEKQKQKRRGEINGVADDVPEQDLIEDEAPEQSEADKQASKVKAAKDKAAAAAAAAASSTESESEKKQGKRKKTAWDEDEAGKEGGEESEKPSKKSKKDVTQRFILFVGNLGFRTTKDRIEAVFRQALGMSPDPQCHVDDRYTHENLGETPSVRLLTNKAKPGSTMGPTSRGIAFVEFPNSTLLQQALKLHHTDIDGRRINVELTAGGGGSGQARKEKIEARQGRLGEQREKRAEKEKEEGGAGAAAAAAAGTEGHGETSVPEVKDAAAGSGAGGGDGDVKMRGGRRIKAKPQGGDQVSNSPLPKRKKPPANNVGWATTTR